MCTGLLLSSNTNVVGRFQFISENPTWNIVLTMSIMPSRLASFISVADLLRIKLTVHFTPLHSKQKYRKLNKIRKCQKLEKKYVTDFSFNTFVKSVTSLNTYGKDTSHLLFGQLSSLHTVKKVSATGKLSKVLKFIFLSRLVYHAIFFLTCFLLLLFFETHAIIKSFQLRLHHQEIYPEWWKL